MEMVIAVAIMGVIMIVVGTLMVDMADEMQNSMISADIHTDLNWSITKVSRDIQECPLDLMTLRRFDETQYAGLTLPDGSTPGNQQTAICLATARDMNDDFICTSGVAGSKEISALPSWQGVIVYAVYKGTLYRYADWNSHSYGNTSPVSINPINSGDTTITLSDGTTWNRDGTNPGTNQRVLPVVDRVAQFYIPNYTEPPGSIHVKLSNPPLQVQFVGIKEAAGHIEDSVAATFFTEILARNKNN